jgi:terminase large subunit-like protein
MAETGSGIVRSPRQSLAKPRFFRDLGYEPHPGQQAIHSSPAPRRIVACGVRWGKTLCAAMEGLCAAMQPKKRSIGWVVAPTYDLCDKVFRELVVLAAEHLRHRIVTLKESERRLVLRNLSGGVSEIRGKSADNPVSLLGEGLDWLIADEASRLKPTIWESHLSQRLLDKRGWALLISTPKGKGWFFDLFRRGQGDDPDYASWNHPTWTNPHVSRELIEEERGRLPERVFKQEYGGEFLEGAGQVFRYVREAAVLDWQRPVADRTYYAGLDLAKVEDFTVLVIVNTQREVVFVDRFHRLDWSQQVDRIQTATDRYNHAEILVDTTGMGEPIYEALTKAGCYVSPYPFTGRSKAALVDNLALMLERRDIKLPRADLWPEGIDELEAFQFSVTDQGNVRSSAPSGTHDDCVIALALAAWSVRIQAPNWSVRYVRGLW